MFEAQPPKKDVEVDRGAPRRMEEHEVRYRWGRAKDKEPPTANASDWSTFDLTDEQKAELKASAAAEPLAAPTPAPVAVGTARPSNGATTLGFGTTGAAGPSADAQAPVPAPAPATVSVARPSANAQAPLPASAPAMTSVAGPAGNAQASASASVPAPATAPATVAGNVVGSQAPDTNSSRKRSAGALANWDQPAQKR